MPILMPTDIYGEIVFLGVNGDREAGLRSAPIAASELTIDHGMPGEAHGGPTRPSCSRVKLQYPRGTEIRNTRQVTVLSEEELAAVAADMGLPGPISPESIGVNILLRGVPDLTQVPPGSRLVFDSGASLVVDMENGPCRFAAEEIERDHPGLGMSFPKIAAGRRGVTAFVERPGPIKTGDRCRLHCPPLRIYAHALRG